MSDARWRAVMVGAVLLACSICYFVGRKQGVTDERLAVNAAEMKKADAVVKVDSAKADTAIKRADTVAVLHKAARKKVETHADTTRVLGKVEQHGDTAVIISKDLSSLITITDVQQVTDPLAIVALKIAVADLKKTVKLRDERIKILESEVTPGKFKKVLNAAKWVLTGAVIGVAYSNR